MPHHFVTIEPGGVTLADWQVMINAAGGNTKWKAFYDGRANVTFSAGVASSWADARGAGFGPALIGAGTQQPSYVGSDHLVFDGVNNILQCAAAQSMFDLSQTLSLICIGTVLTSASNGRGMAAVNSDGGIPSTNMLAIGPRANPNQQGTIWHSPSATTWDTGVACDNTLVRLSIVVNAGTTGKAQVANHAVQTATVTATGAGSNYLCVGAFFQSPVDGIGATALYNVAVYAGDIEADGYAAGVMTWAQTYRSSTAAS